MISEETGKLIDLVAATLAEEDMHQNDKDRYESDACRVVAELQSKYQLTPLETDANDAR